MARYIDADALLEHYKILLEHAQIGGMYNHAKLYERFILSIKDATTADVVQRSEVENYKQVAEYQQKLAMDRYFEIKRLQEDVDRLQDINNRQVENVRLAKQEVAREIFEKIEKAISKGFEYGTFFDVKRNIAKLKKKYTEGKT